MDQLVVPARGEVPLTADVVIVGGGIVGVASAFFCSRLGMTTVVVEKRETLGSLTTAVSTECFRAQFENPELIGLMRSSIEIFADFPAVVGIPHLDIGLRRQGYLYITGDPQRVERYEKLVEVQSAAGLNDVDLLSGEEARTRFHYLGPRVVAARYRAGDGWLSVHELLHGFAKGSRARFLLDTAAVGIMLDANGIAGVETNKGIVQTRRAVICAGPFSGRVARLAQVNLPLTLLRRHTLVVRSCDLVPRTAPFTMDDDTGVYWRPAGAGAFIGKAFEDQPEDPTDAVPVDWEFPSLVLTPGAEWSIGRLVPFWNRAPNLLSKSNLHLSAGQYVYTPDHKPIIGPCREVPGLYFNLGYAGYGIMGAPEGGRRLAQMLQDARPDTDNPFSYTRFPGASQMLEAQEKVY